MNAGDSISRYRIIREVGHGGMGVVYQAEDTKLDRPVALKFLPSEGLNEQARMRFVNEAKAAAQVRHQNICQIYDIEDTQGKVFIAMAYLDGETLSHRLAGGPLTEGLAVSIALQVAEGLGTAHAAGVVHRDIKSANIMVGNNGHVSIMDFGLALRTGDSRLTEVGHTVGTPSYMSPEQAMGRPVGPGTDIWSLGVVLYEMLTGQLPFRRERQEAVIHAILHDPVTWPQTCGIDARLQRIVELALAKDPARRYQSAGQMAEDLRRVAGIVSVYSAGAHAAGDSTRTMVIAVKGAGRRRAWVPAIAAAVVLVLAVVGWWVYRQRQIAAEMGRQVAVLPFVVVGNSEGYRVIADGLLEVLTSAISDSERFHGRITAVPASEIRARGIKSPSDARRIYGVDLAIAGSVQPGMADKLQFSLALIDTAKLKQVGTVRFEYDPTRPIQSRDAAVVALARMLDLDLTEEVKEFVATGDSAVPGAYSAYLEATGLLSRYDVPGNADKAIVSLKRAVELDPKYALAYAGLAEAYWRKAQSAGSRQDLVALAMENAARGVELGPNLAVTHAVEGQIFGAFGREQEAVAELTKAVEIAPGSPDALRGLARVLANLGRYDEAEALYRKAIRLRPLDWYGHQLLGVLLMQEERYGDAEPAFRRARELSPNNLLVRRSLGLLYYNQGRYAEAIQQLTFPGASETAFSLELLAAAYHHEHRFKDAIEATNRAIALTPATAELWGNLAIFYKWDSDTESQYLPTLRKAVALTAETLKASPGDYHSRANMAEYLARLGDKRGAAAEIDKIPESARKPFAVPLATAYELSGRRADAIAMIRAQVSNPATLSQIKDDPDLAGLWADPALQSAIRAPSPTN